MNSTTLGEEAEKLTLLPFFSHAEEARLVKDYKNSMTIKLYQLDKQCILVLESQLLWEIADNQKVKES